MNPAPDMMSSPAIQDGAIHLLLTEGDVQTMTRDPEQAMRDIHQRATQMSVVLERILREPHGEPDWGLNE